MTCIQSSPKPEAQAHADAVSQRAQYDFTVLGERRGAAVRVS
ncbi:hypothetical protein [Kribbella turkmenica]|nr:hypothetical protein [Kribbella turkmenica]